MNLTFPTSPSIAKSLFCWPPTLSPSFEEPPVLLGFVTLHQ
jgi:hypothetical protein